MTAAAGAGPIMVSLDEESTMKTSVVRTLIVLAAVSLAASSAVGADRVMLAELFTATW